MAITVTLTIADARAAAVLSALEFCADATLRLTYDSDIANLPRHLMQEISWAAKEVSETDKDFAKRALIQLMRGIVGIEIRHDEEERVKAARDAITPITVDIPEDIIT